MRRGRSWAERWSSRAPSAPVPRPPLRDASADGTGLCACRFAGQSQVMMRWNERPRRALVLLKPDQDLLPLAAQTVDFLQREMGLHVMVEAAAAEGVSRVSVPGVVWWVAAHE